MNSVESFKPLRHETDFENLGLLGEGAFGQVHKVKNKLDNVCFSRKKLTPNYTPVATLCAKAYTDTVN